MNLFYFLLIILFVSSAYSQNQVIVRLTQPPPNKLGIAELWSLELVNTTGREIRAYAVGTVSEARDGLILEATSKLFTIKPGRNVYTYRDFPNADVRYHNSRYRDIILRTGNAPSGDYTICISIRSETGDELGSDCIHQRVEIVSPPTPVFPADGDTLYEEQSPTFTWTPPTPVPQEVTYHLRIVEILGDQPPLEAMRQNPAWFEQKDIRTTSLQYPAQARKLESGKKYAWRVSALIAGESVESEVSHFVVARRRIARPIEQPPSPRIQLRSPPCVKPPKGMVAWWPMDEQNGATALVDIVNGTPVTTVQSALGNVNSPQSVTGLVKGAIQFPSAFTRAVISTLDLRANSALNNIGSGDFTIDAWIKLPQPLEPGSPLGGIGNLKNATIVNRYGGPKQVGYHLHVRSPGASNNERLIFWWSDASLPHMEVHSNVKISINKWHHVAVTFKRLMPPWQQAPPGGYSFEVRLYIDGTQVGYQVGNPSGGVGSLVEPTLPLTIGNSRAWGGDQPIIIDELEFFNRALDTAEIQAIYNAGSAGKCKPPEIKCCQFALRLYNTIPDIKQLVIIPTDPQAIIGVFNDEDEEDWSLTLSGNNYIIQPIGGFFPADLTQLLDLDFAIRVNPAKSPTTVRVLWLDATGNLVKEEELTLECLTDERVGEEDFDYDWFSKRKVISGVGDDVLFAGAEQEECEDFENDPFARTSVCGFTDILKCNNNQNVLELTASYSGANSYNWQITDNKTTSSPSGQTVNYSLTEGQHDIKVKLTVDYNDSQGKQQTETCSKTIDTCIPTADFSVGTPQPVCVDGQVQGWKVTFTPNSDGVCNASTITWDFGDGSTSTQSGSVTHTYAATTPASYDVTLTVQDQWGCTHTKRKPVTISGGCKPSFRIVYELCPPDTIGKREIQVPVKFINESQKFCSTTFEWDFGDGTTVTNNSDTVVHTYTVPISQLPQTYTVTLTMKDNQKCPSGVSTSITYQLKPVSLDPKVVVCPDGETHFVANTPGKVKWELSGVGFWCEVKVFFANLFNDQSFTCDLDNGTYGSKVTATEEEQGGLVKRTCTKSQAFTVQKTCCDDFKVKDRRDVTVNGKVYRMKFKHKVVKPTFWLGTRIVGKTKFKVRKKLLGNIPYFKGIKAEQISVTINNTLTEGGPHLSDPTITCERCITPSPYDNGNLRTNSSKAKVKDHVSARGTRYQDVLTSIHYVKHKDGWDWTITVTKPQNGTCADVSITSSK